MYCVPGYAVVQCCGHCCDGCCSVVCGTRVGVSVFSMMCSELLIMSEIS